VNSDSGARYPLYILSFFLEAVAIRVGTVYSVSGARFSHFMLSGAGTLAAVSLWYSLLSLTALWYWYLGCSDFRRRGEGVLCLWYSLLSLNALWYWYLGCSGCRRRREGVL